MITIELTRFQSRALRYILRQDKKNLMASRAALEDAKLGPDGELDADGIEYGIKLCDSHLKAIDEFLKQSKE